MKKAIVFAGLFVSAFLGFQNVVSGISILIRALHIEGYTMEPMVYIGLVLGVLLLMFAVAGIALMVGSLKSKDENQGYLTSSILLVVCAITLLIGFMPLKIVECSQGISAYLEMLKEPDVDSITRGIAESYVAINTIYIVVAVIEATLVAALSVLSFVKSEGKKSN